MIKFPLLILVFAIIGFDLSFQLPQLSGRIVGGQDAKIKDVPYQLSLWYSNDFICGASIIHIKWSITAAHCLSIKGLNKNYLSVGAGSEFKKNGNCYKILTVIIHSSYKTTSADNDIALLEIQGEFKFGEFINAVELPEATFEPPSGLEVTVSGWGCTEEKNCKIAGGVNDSESLKKVSVTIVNHKECETNYKQKKRLVTKNMICAGDLKFGGKDACINDSGGPMVANRKLYGIVSWGEGCGNKNYPGVYTHVAKYIKWIKKNAKI
ncbi:trypsin-2-like [Leptopilina heterotoma]|uniref:trypsin-2-like n=1 Tax=Leptopilina heterotoma TaxID=63436 RepID=UPI001CA9C637|nr:trypsin-2-like [Leptopilina heterotoma]